MAVLGAIIFAVVVLLAAAVVLGALRSSRRASLRRRAVAVDLPDTPTVPLGAPGPADPAWPAREDAAAPARGPAPAIRVEGELAVLDLPSPDDMRGRWAAVAAVMAAAGLPSRDCHADSGDWYHHDGGGNWARMRRYADGRALLVGHDRDSTRTVFGEAAEVAGRTRTDLLAGAPSWWSDAVTHHDHGDGESIGFIYGWDGQVWRRAVYDVDDGFMALELPPVSEARTMEVLLEYGYAERTPPGPDSPAARTLMEACPDATELQVGAVGPALVEPAAGVAVARGFLAPGRW